jgi:hypothetical protein
MSQPRLIDLYDYGPRNPRGDGVLHRVEVVRRRIVAVGPQLFAVAGLDQLHGDTDGFAGMAHAAMHDVVGLRAAVPRPEA